MFHFSAEMYGREIVSKVTEIVDGETDDSEAVCLDSSPFVKGEKNRDLFVVIVV